MDSGLVGGVGHMTINFVGYVQLINGNLQVEIYFSDTQNDALTNRDN